MKQTIFVKYENEFVEVNIKKVIIKREQFGYRIGIFEGDGLPETKNSMMFTNVFVTESDIASNSSISLSNYLQVNNGMLTWLDKSNEKFKIKIGKQNYDIVPKHYTDSSFGIYIRTYHWDGNRSVEYDYSIPNNIMVYDVDNDSYQIFPDDEDLGIDNRYRDLYQAILDGRTTFSIVDKQYYLNLEECEEKNRIIIIHRLDKKTDTLKVTARITWRTEIELTGDNMGEITRQYESLDLLSEDVKKHCGEFVETISIDKI